MKKYDDMKQNEEVWTMAQRIEEAELREDVYKRQDICRLPPLTMDNHI